MPESTGEPLQAAVNLTGRKTKIFKFSFIAFFVAVVYV